MFQGNASRSLKVFVSLHGLSACRHFSQKNFTTHMKYPQLKRGSYSVLQEKDICWFKNILTEPNQVITADEESLCSNDELSGFNVDWTGSFKGSSRLVLRPKTTDQVSKILSYCNQHRIAVVPQSGNTGLVGGSVPVFDEIILSLGLMNSVISVDELTGIVIVEAGCVLGKLELALDKNNLTLPLDLGAKGSCMIGGNVATNAGGIRLLRYGNLHGSVLGLTAVLANGEILDSMSSNKKDNTGYDLKQLFIGSEGTLGIITQLALNCPVKSTSVMVGFVGVTSFENVLNAVRLAKSFLGEILSSIEFVDQSSIECVTAQLKLVSPIGSFPFYILFETSGCHPDHDAEKFNSFLEHLLKNGTIADGTIAGDLTRINSLWALRERITEALASEGYVYKYDVSVPTRQFYQLVEEMRIRLGNAPIRCCGYGHIGDGNLHLNITSREYDPELYKSIEPYIYQWVSRHKGSISAEHGLGLRKREFIGFSKSQTSIKWMKKIKKILDPNAILNPYKVL